jgi:PhoH-like ATPase
MAKKNYVIDTSVFLTDSSCLFKFGNNDLFIAHKVLEEIDKHKKRQDSVGFHARQIIKQLDELREKGSLSKGIRLGKGMGILKVEEASRPLPGSLSMRVPDHQILGVALAVKEAFPKRKTIMLSRDINMRVIADACGLISEDYETLKVVEDVNKIYTGFLEIVVDDELIEQFYNDEEVFFDGLFQQERKIKLYPNQFLILISSSNPKKSALARFVLDEKPIEKVRDDYKNLTMGIFPRNKEQKFSYDLLFDDSIKFVSLIGKAGSGKTLMAIAAGMEQTLSLNNKNNIYRKIVVSRPVQPLGKDIGFLPGTMHEKMMPWLMPIQDNMETILGKDNVYLAEYVERGKIQIEALTYIRGRSINNAFIVIDEAQNLTAHEVKTILTRVGENTKIVLTGDIEQIDNIYTNETSNGLTYAVEKFKHHDISGHITFLKGERSRLATISSKIL